MKDGYIEALFEHIKHGDDNHRKWLYDELYKFERISKMNVKVKKLNDKAIIPAYSKPGDAGLDLTATSKSYEGDNVVYGTGLAIEIPEGYVGLLFPRSSLSNYDLSLTNSVGVIDSGYRGELIFKFKETLKQPYQTDNGEYTQADGRAYKVGERIGQLLIIPYPKVELVEVKELSSSERGSGSYGSSGK